MSEIRVDKLKNEAGSGAVELTEGASIPTGKNLTGAGGINITGVARAGSFVGNLTSNVTGNADTATTATNAQGITGTPDVTVNNVVAGVITATTYVGVPEGTNVLKAMLFV